MDPTLFKALLALLPASTLFAGAVLFVRAKSPRSLLQLLGAAGLLLVILTHICEGLYLLPWMGWGLEHSAGHYVDLCGALLAFTLFPAGYLLHALGRSNRQIN
jgi:succinate dehydrogenase/fumarate reductase cytochrome b subunit